MSRPARKTDELLRRSSLFLLFFALLPISAHAGVEETQLKAVARMHCDQTLYPSLCVSTLTRIPNLASKSLPQIIRSAVNGTIGEVLSSSFNYSTILRNRVSSLTTLQKMALNDCLELFQSTVALLQTTISDLSSDLNAAKRADDIRTLLSASIANQYTCLDGFIGDAAGKNSSLRPIVESVIKRVSRLVSNSLAMAGKIRKQTSFSPSSEPFEGYGKVDSERFPRWLTRRDRRLLQAPISGLKPNLIVAKDGSGNFSTISAAVAAAPNNTGTRFVIYIKAGGYLENVELISKKTNLMFIGDGMGKTVVKASRNVVDGWTTFRSATVAVVGAGFIARDMSFENAAGPSKQQAVALRSGSDLSVFYRCSFVGYQDTLYVHSLRQFYRECDIYGTVDFIFGDAAAVLQNCSLYARKPNPKQKNIFTAQGRQDPNENTGISIQGCKVASAADLLPVRQQFKNYLGRPWRQYSRTVYMHSLMEDLIDPAGWLEWSGSFALSTLYYGEYQNRGPGSNTTRRVTWPGYRVINSSAEAAQFTVKSFIQGDQWLPATAIPFIPGF